LEASEIVLVEIYFRQKGITGTDKVIVISDIQGLGEWQ